MAEILSVTLLPLASVVFSIWRMRQYLRFFQQEEYDSGRFLRWIAENQFFDRKASGFLLAILLIAHLVPDVGSLKIPLLLLACLGLPIIGSSEQDPRSEGKIRLRMTERAQRIYRLGVGSFGLFSFFLVPFFLRIPFSDGFDRVVLSQLLAVQSMPLFLVLAVFLLAPGERKLQAGFIAEAKARLLKVNPTVVGITGSYGKTSTKAILGKMLELGLGPTFWPEKGINTEMGITRSIRENLSDAHRFAVIEMGAYRPGSIAKLCALTPPNAAIITAVGLMHLERMGGAERVLLAKSELAQHVPDDGILVCNGDNAGAREIARRHPKKTTLLYGLKKADDLACFADNVRFAAEGTHFRLHWKGKDYEGFTPLHGRPALSNILASFTMAATLGGDPEYLLAAVRSLEPVNNRLEVKPVGTGLQINDAYNSNPEGFAAALEVLEALPGKRKILVTPGMIELGDEQAAENARLAKLAGEFCDIVFVVGALNRGALLSGLTEAGLSGEYSVRCFETRDEALTALQEIRGSEDVVLLENDLPDLYELDIRL